MSKILIKEQQMKKRYIRYALIGWGVFFAGLTAGQAQQAGAGMMPAGQGILEETRTRLRSPDGRLSVELYQKQSDDGKRKLFYKVFFKDRPVILESGLDIRMDNHIMESAL